MFLSKAAFARHLSQPHGRATCAVPLAELRRWRRDELEREHNRLLSAGGKCPSFREHIVTKAEAQ